MTTRRWLVAVVKAAGEPCPTLTWTRGARRAQRLKPHTDAEDRGAPDTNS